MEQWQHKEKADLASRIAQLKNVPANALSARVNALSKDIEGKELEQQKLGGLPSLVMGGTLGSGIAARLKLGLEIELLKQERDHIAYLLSAIKAPENLEELRIIKALFQCRTCKKGKTDVDNGECLVCSKKQYISETDNEVTTTDIPVMCKHVKQNGERCKIMTTLWAGKCHLHVVGVNIFV